MSELLIKAGLGQVNAGLVLKNANVINVFDQSVIKADVAICGNTIVGIGTYSGDIELDLNGAYVAPGFIDAHVHIESSMVSPPQFAKAVAPHGTTTVIADPHEIANVLGVEGIRLIRESAKDLPIDVFIMLPSCVPTSDFETAGASLGASELNKLINDPGVLGLGEMMNYPGVINADAQVMKKLEVAKSAHKIIDGHAPRLSGKELAAYALAGIKTDHECETPDELNDKVANGMYVLMREGSAAKNVAELSRGVNSRNMRRCLFCTDDRHPEDIISQGSIDNNIRVAVGSGIDPLAAITMATLNAAECYGLSGLGAIAPGYFADLTVLDNLTDLNVVMTFKGGKISSEKGELRWPQQEVNFSSLKNSVNLSPFSAQKLVLKVSSDKANAIELTPHSIITKKTVVDVITIDGAFVPGNDLLKLVVAERHHSTGNVAMGIVKGFGLKGGAIASSVAHDSHNIICVGDNDVDILTAIEELARVHGGVTICRGGAPLKTLALPIAGLMSDLPLEEVSRQMEEMKSIATSMGVLPECDPFMTLAFLSLPVIPSIKLTDKGLFDVDVFEFIEISI